MDEMDEQTRMLMPAVYCSGKICPVTDKKPCTGTLCPKWYELIPEGHGKSSFGKCTLIVFRYIEK